MLDGLSLDQLRSFVTTVEEGSFSAAGRKLGRAQSAVSELIANLEGQLGVSLFDRSGRYPKLTRAGEVLLADARGVVESIGYMKSRARGMAAGIEAELAVAFDVLFPLNVITEAARGFHERFPDTPLRVYVEALGGAYQPVLDGRASLGVVGSLPLMPSELTGERIASVTMVMVAGGSHPLALRGGTIPRSEVARHLQLVLTDRSTLSSGREFGVLSSSTWRLADLFAKHAFLLDGLGWGGMPLHAVAADIAAGRLVVLDVEDVGPGGLSLPMSAVYPPAAPPGPAARWLVDRLRECASEKAHSER
ncbi:LysR family transcriptional regulator [uncultured Sphingomonas sp.]|uniref:LysR family transcriptional regulator n=1 Tax=uncultured Sphingomonas sp. TaxID=158754 RepID=UPI0035C978D4